MHTTKTENYIAKPAVLCRSSKYWHWNPRLWFYRSASVPISGSLDDSLPLAYNIQVVCKNIGQTRPSGMNE